ncbi:major facilitator superfamily protein [Lineolata rhizophorae]|uniref:Major facilitator superfamily protein n=1 Tax=Lineolata rhizophorae TaxID=578093 RepID=A0A6A6P7D0_9PEZI|nr:major facilitator superfamily protein [Lineolata rhizophorae]
MASDKLVEPHTEQKNVAYAENEESTVDPSAESNISATRLLWKVDLHVFPIFFVIYVLGFLDRINIGNARIQGMQEDLELTGSRYNIALFIFFIPYIIFEVPSNILLKHVRPPIYLSSLMFVWGIINMCMGFVKTYQALVALRFFLGVFEAGVLPGIIYLSSMYYKRHEFQKRLSFFFCSTLVAGAFGGLLAFAIAKLQGRAGYNGWQWIFIIEGAVTAFVAAISYFLIVDWPESCKFLTENEKTFLLNRTQEDRAGGIAQMDKLNKFSAMLILKDWKIWLCSFIYMGVGLPGLAAVFFMPTILNEFGWEASDAQVHTIPVYACCLVVMLATAWASDRLRHRFSFIFGGVCVSTIGHAMLLNQDNLSREAKYGAVFLTQIGIYAGLPIALVWLSNNMGGHYKRAIGAGLQVSFGNVAGIIGSNIFLRNERPKYPTGYGTSLGMLWMGGLCSLVLFVMILYENRKRERGGRDYRLEYPPEKVQNLGDDHPSFRYTT